MDKDRYKAFKWFLESANNGCALGQYNLGYCYKNGFGVPKDYNEAFKWFEKAAKQNDANAQFIVDRMNSINKKKST